MGRSVYRPEPGPLPGLPVIESRGRQRVATPVNWQQDDEVIIAGSVSDEEARKRYPQDWEAPKSSMRIVPQPSKSGRPAPPAMVMGRRNSFLK